VIIPEVVLIQLSSWGWSTGLLETCRGFR